jgi:DNA polymerase-3 subunit delta'
MIRAAKRISHAYLIVGGDNEKRLAKAHNLTYEILCKDGGCERCRTCTMLEASSHPDVKILNGDAKWKVKDAEKFIEDTYIKGLESDTKLYFINHAHTLSREVQNKLLKVYEEPPKGSVIFLLSANETNLLKTIVSRAEVIYIPNDYRAEFLLLLEQEGAEDRLDGAVEILLGCKKSADIIDHLFTEAFLKENILQTLNFLEIILGDVLTMASGNINTIVNERQFDIQEIKKGFSTASASVAVLAVADAKRKLSVNVAPASVAEALLFEILEAKYKF